MFRDVSDNFSLTEPGLPNDPSQNQPDTYSYVYFAGGNIP